MTMTFFLRSGAVLTTGITAGGAAIAAGRAALATATGAAAGLAGAASPVSISIT